MTRMTCVSCTRPRYLCIVDLEKQDELGWESPCLCNRIRLLIYLLSSYQWIGVATGVGLLSHSGSVSPLGADWLGQSRLVSLLWFINLFDWMHVGDM